MKRRIKNLPSENTFDFTEYVEKFKKAQVIDKMPDEYDDHPSIDYTGKGNVYRYYRRLKPVNRSEHGRGADEFKKI